MIKDPKPELKDENKKDRDNAKPAEINTQTAVRGRPFPKGESGNPGGRPRVEGEIRRLAQQHAGAAFLNVVRLMNSSNHRVALAASAAVLDRAIGKPAGQADLRNEDRLSHEDFRSFTENLLEVQANVDADVRLRHLLKWP